MESGIVDMRQKVKSLKKYISERCNSRDIMSSHKGNIGILRWSHDGKYLATGSTDRSAHIYHFTNDRIRKEYEFTGHPEYVDHICFHPVTSDVLATSSIDKVLRLFDCRTGKSTSSITTKGAENLNMAWSPDGTTISLGDKHDMISFIDVRKQRVVHEEQFKKEVNEMQWHPQSNKLLYVTTGDGCVLVMSWPQMKMLYELQAHGNSSTIIAIQFDNTGEYMSVGCADSCYSVWQTHDLVPLSCVTRLDWPVRTLSFSHDSTVLAAASEGAAIDLCYPETGDQLHRIEARGSVYAMAFHPKKYLLAYACEEKYDRERGTVHFHGDISRWSLSLNTTLRG